MTAYEMIAPVIVKLIARQQAEIDRLTAELAAVDANLGTPRSLSRDNLGRIVWENRSDAVQEPENPATIRKVVYRCGCVAIGDDVAESCEIHGEYEEG